MGSYIVKIEIYAAIVQQEEISNGIDTLDGEWVGIVCLEEPGVLGLDEVSRRLFRP